MTFALFHLTRCEYLLRIMLWLFKVRSDVGFLLWQVRLSMKWEMILRHWTEESFQLKIPFMSWKTNESLVYFIASCF